MKKSKTFFACAMLAALASCSNDHVLSQQSPTPSAPDVINIVAASSKPVTRAANIAADMQDTQFDTGQKINVYLHEHGTNLGSNDNTFTNPYVYEVGTATSGNEKSMTITTPPHFPITGKAVDAYAFYPAISGDTGYDIKHDTNSFTVLEDQKDKDKYRKCDLMFGTNNWDPNTHAALQTFNGTAKGNDVKLYFRHILSKIVVNLTHGTGLQPSDLTNAKIKLKGAVPTATISINGDGITTSNPSGTAPRDGYDLGTYDATNGNAAIIIPQVIDTGNPFIEITLSNNAKYVYKLADTDGGSDNKMTFASGKKYIYNLTLSAGNVVVVSAAIENWGDGGGDNNGNADLQPAS